jgi:response regulator NasT
MTQSLRIAVADDEPDMRDYLKKVLERLGHIVLGPVENGLALVDLCLNAGPDLVITDIRMPELDGDEALLRIQRENPVPCIVLSAFGNPDQWAFETDKMDWAFLDKPFRKNDLHEAIRLLMSPRLS